MSIYKTKISNFHGSILLIFLVDARSKSYLPFKLSEPIRTSYHYRDIRLRNLPIIFRMVNLVCLYIGFISPNFPCILVKNLNALVLCYAINANFYGFMLNL